MREDYFFDTEADLEAQEQLNVEGRCPICGAKLVHEGGCVTCYSCGWSAKEWHELEILDGLFDKINNEINEAREQEIHANSINGTYYWKGYREGLERVVTILYKTLKQNIFSSKQ
jgi:predicted amidophosphoribosyltransferase